MRTTKYLRGKILKKYDLGKFEKIRKRLKMLRGAVRNTLSPSFKDNQYSLEANPELTYTDRNISGSLMRVNHAGEIAAQGLYVGQALFARDEYTYKFLMDASHEEFEHLEACHRRLSELGEKEIRLSPIWFVGSVIIGSYFGLKGDKSSLGFVAETERQVENHLMGQLAKVPTKDLKTKNLLESMINDEKAHGEEAKSRGGVIKSDNVRTIMTLVSEAMKQISYKF